MLVHIINLKRRTDRWAQCKKLPFAIKRFDAYDGSLFKMIEDERNNRAFHCIISHLALLESLDEDMAFVGEDDLEIVDLPQIQKCVEEFAKSDYDVINLGFDKRWMPQFGKQHEYIQEVVSGPTLTTSFYCVKKAAIPKMLEALRYCADAMLKGATLYTHAADWAWSFPQFGISRCVPKNEVCKQFHSTSDIAI